MTKASFAPIPSRVREVREGIGAGIAFVLLFVLHALILRPPLPRTILLIYAILTLALAGLYVVSGLFQMSQRIARSGALASLPVFLLGNGLILVIALVLWGRSQLYFALFILNGYGALVYYTGKRRWALAFAGAMLIFAWLVYALLEGWQAAWPAVAGDLPWYGLTIALAEIVARQREHRQQVEGIAEKLAQAHLKLQDYVSQAEELTITRERARLAHELHDTVGHTLTALDVQLELLVRLPPGHPEQRRKAAMQARSLVKEGLADMRRAVQALRPAALESFSLPVAINALITSFVQTTDIATDWRIDGEESVLPLRLALPLYRTAQEGLTNIQRHAPSTPQVRIRLRYEPEAVLLTMANARPTQGDDHGSEVEKNGGHGLAGLRERAEMLGGSFEAGPEEGGGFRVEISLPVAS